MDENNLDRMLEELSAMDGELNDNLDLDSGIDLDMSDMDGISLDELDALGEMDFSDMDFDDIDFDDVDITNLEVGEQPTVNRHEDTDMNLDSLLEQAEENMQEGALEEEDDFDSMLPEDMGQEEEDEVFVQAQQQAQEESEMDGFFDDQTFDTLTEDKATAPQEADPFSELSSEFDDFEINNLDIPEKGSASTNPYTAGEDSLDALLQSSMELGLESGDLADIEDIDEVKSKKKKGSRNKDGKKKRSLSEIIFGEPDQDDLEEEVYLAERKAKKEEDKEKKKAEKEVINAEKAAKKAEKLALKQKEQGAKQAQKDAKKQAQQEAYEQELEEEKNQKKVPTAVVIIVFVLFALLGAGVVFGTKGFNYSQVIRKATDYFNRQRYRLAYNQVSGVDVKEKDQPLKDRIYTVMYVERLYESYETNLKLGRFDKALDALLRGVQKYDEHYQEAVELDIVQDIDGCRAKIVTALWTTYGLTEDTAYNILAMDGQEYTQRLLDISKQIEEQLQTPTDAAK